MKKEQLIQKVCETCHITAYKSYEAVALYFDDMNALHLSGYVVNDEYMIDERTEKIYPVSTLTQIGNVDTYED